jgi:hypothetical protein
VRLRRVVLGRQGLGLRAVGLRDRQPVRTRVVAALAGLYPPVVAASAALYPPLRPDEQAHGRREIRRMRIWIARPGLPSPHAAQATQVKRRRIYRKTGKT